MTYEMIFGLGLLLWMLASVTGVLVGYIFGEEIADAVERFAKRVREKKYWYRLRKRRGD